MLVCSRSWLHVYVDWYELRRVVDAWRPIDAFRRCLLLRVPVRKSINITQHFIAYFRRIRKQLHEFIHANKLSWPSQTLQWKVRCTHLETSGHTLFEALSGFWISQTHILVFLFQIRPVLHHTGHFLTVCFFQALLSLLHNRFVIRLNILICSSNSRFE